MTPLVAEDAEDLVMVDKARDGMMANADGNVL
jgi:hypothetical protein